MALPTRAPRPLSPAASLAAIKSINSYGDGGHRSPQEGTLHFFVPTYALACLAKAEALPRLSAADREALREARAFFEAKALEACTRRGP